MGLFSRRKRAATDDPPLANTALENTAPLHTGSSPIEAFELLVDRERARLAAAGTWWTGAERLAIAAEARRALAGETPSGTLPPPVAQATRRIAVEAATIRGTDVARWENDGLGAFGYVEIVGIVSRLAALDITAFGLGREAPRLPEPQPGEPSRAQADGAVVTTGWAPTVGPATAPSSLSAVPAEAEAMFDVHGVLYLTMDQMFEMQIERDGLSRPQIELVASRTSALNECFY